MSSTRQKPLEDNAPLSQERYMSSPEFTELRGVSGTAVAARVAIVDDPTIRRLLFFLQSKSLEPGGLKQVAREILTNYQDRIGTPSMHKFGMKTGQTYKAEQVRLVRSELPRGSGFPLRGETRCRLMGDYILAADLLRDANTTYEIERAHTAIAESRTHPGTYPSGVFVEFCHRNATPELLTTFLTDLCINPRLTIRDSSAGDKEQTAYAQRLENEFPNQRLELKAAELFWFRDIIGALLDYQRCQEEAAKNDFVLTAIGRKVWDTLDFSLRSRRMVVVEGWEGRGKTEAVKAWCRAHRGEARYITLSGVTNKTTVFREIARALGIACSYKRKSTEMQARVEDVLRRTGLLLVVDEAHFCFSQSARVYTRPELVDWIDSSLVNHGIPVALITTPQFINCVKRAEEQAGWNYRQFRRRVARWIQLPQWNTDTDLEAVAKKIFPGLSKAGIKLALGYAKVSLHGSPSRDISGLGDVATEARILAENDGRTAISFDDVDRAITDYLMPSDEVFASRMASPGKRQRKRFSKPFNEGLTPVTDGSDRDDSISDPKEDFVRHRTGQVAGNGRAVTPRASSALLAA